jgi:hypothetical protein
MTDLAVFALWPVIETPRLPDGWQEHLAELTSLRLAALVSQARQLGARGRPVAVEGFARTLAAKPFTHGVLALLEDLADPQGGGASLTVLALAGGFPPPPRKPDTKALLGWLIGAGAVGGATASATPMAAERAWLWLHDRLDPSDGTLQPGDVDVPDPDADPQRHGGSARGIENLRRQGGGATDFIEDLFN